MKCERLISLIKGWYLKVQEEAMAPARMVAFMETHIAQCEECLADQDVKQEAEKIREIVLPPSKVPKPKVVRVPKPETEIAEDKDKNDAAQDDAAQDEVAEDEVAEDEVAEDEVAEDSDDADEDDENYDPDLLDDDEI